MTCSPIRSIAVIGSGISGLTVCNLAREAGLEPVLFEKARGPGGRISSKRLSGDALDMGAQYFTVRNADFRRFLKRYAQDAVAPWAGRLLHENAHGELEPFPGDTRWVGVPRMSALPGPLQHRWPSKPRPQFGGPGNRMGSGSWRRKGANTDPMMRWLSPYRPLRPRHCCPPCQRSLSDCVSFQWHPAGPLRRALNRIPGLTLKA